MIGDVAPETSAGMSMMEQVLALRSALSNVPLTLLSDEDRRVLADVGTSLEVAERILGRGRLVVFVGPSGSGKSFVYNRLAGPDASPEGVLRPTTSGVVITGHREVPGLTSDLDLVRGASLKGGFEVADTPGWEHDPGLVATMTAVADLVVVVVSPIRYADSSVASLWETLDRSRTLIILNRLSLAGSERARLMASVAAVFGQEPYVIEEGDPNPTGLAPHLLAAITTERADALHSIMVRSAAAGARFVARAIDDAARDIEHVRTVVDLATETTPEPGMYDVQSSWQGTRDGIVASVAREVRDRDDDVMRRSETPLAERILHDLGPWDESTLVSSLDDWRDRCVEIFTERATIRWRRSNANQLIERFSWKTSINRGVVTPKRVSRIMGARFSEAQDAARSDLETRYRDAISTRTTAWFAALDELGEFELDGLVSAADGLDDGRFGHV